MRATSDAATTMRTLVGLIAEDQRPRVPCPTPIAEPRAGAVDREARAAAQPRTGVHGKPHHRTKPMLSAKALERKRERARPWAAKSRAASAPRSPQPSIAYAQEQPGCGGGQTTHGERQEEGRTPAIAPPAASRRRILERAEKIEPAKPSGSPSSGNSARRS